MLLTMEVILEWKRPIFNVISAVLITVKTTNVQKRSKVFEVGSIAFYWVITGFI